MNLKHKLIGAIGTAAIVAVGALAASGTHASAQSAGVVVFSGTTSSVTCANGTLPAVGCPGNGIPYAGGGGTYAFTTGTLLGQGVGPKICIEAGSGGANTSCTINSTGAYVNVVCGTGLASGSATVTGTPNITISSYDIAFVAGVGVLAGTTTPLGAVAGVVDITPADTGGTPPTGPCVHNFNVLGAAVAAVS